MTLVVKVNAVVKTGNLLENSLSIEDQLNAIRTASFMMVEKVSVSTGLISSGDEIVIENNGSRIFGGSVKIVSEEQPFNADVFYYQVEAYCFGSYLNNHIVSEVYEEQLAGDILKDIIDNYFSGEGFTYTAVEDGPTINKAVFNYVTAKQAFNEVSELTGYDYYIDCNKDVHFFARETNTAPFNITDAQRNCKELRVTDTHENYRNVQYLRAGYDITDNQTELFAGDGKRITFALVYPVAEAPTITVDASSKTVGILGIDTGKNFYWNKNDKSITQDSGDTVLTSSNELSVTYKGLFPIVIAAEDTEEIAARDAAESGHGRYESIVDDPNIDQLDFAIEKANGLLRRFGSIARHIDFATDVDGLSSGQLITINLTAHGINDSFLIDSVSTLDEAGVGLRHQVRALSGESFGGWADFFHKLAGAGRKFVIRENEVLVKMRSITDTLSFTDSLEYSSASPDCDVSTAEVGYAEVC